MVMSSVVDVPLVGTGKHAKKDALFMQLGTCQNDNEMSFFVHFISS